MMDQAAYHAATQHVQRGNFVFFPAEPSAAPFYWVPLNLVDAPDLYHADDRRRLVMVIRGAKSIVRSLKGSS